MKTFFTNNKAIAVFNCNRERETEAIRFHIYNKLKDKWVYANNFVIEEEGIQPESIIKLVAVHDQLFIQTEIKGEKAEHTYNIKMDTCTVKILKTHKTSVLDNNVFHSLKRISLAMKFYTIFKMPQLLN